MNLNSHIRSKRGPSTSNLGTLKNGGVPLVAFDKTTTKGSKQLKRHTGKALQIQVLNALVLRQRLRQSLCSRSEAVSKRPLWVIGVLLLENRRPWLVKQPGQPGIAIDFFKITKTNTYVWRSLLGSFPISK